MNVKWVGTSINIFSNYTRIFFKYSLIGGLILAPGVQAVTVQTLVLSEQRAPGTPVGGVFDTFYPPLLADSDHYIFRSQLFVGSGGVDYSSDSGIWSGQGTNLSYVARELDQPPGIPSGARYGDFYNCRPVINSAGTVAFSFTMQNDPFGVINSSRNSAIWTGPAGGLSLDFWEGTSTEAPTNANFGEIYTAAVGLVQNDHNEIAFQGKITGSGVSTANDSCLWAGSSNQLTLVAREGSQAPTLPAGATFGSFGSLWLNNSHQVAFSAFLNIGAGGVSSANNSSIWAGSYTNLSVVFREGDIAPGTTNAVFSSFEQYQGGPTNTLIIRATLKNGVGGVDASNDTGFWLWDDDTTELLGREGFPDPVLHETLDAITSVDLSPAGTIGIMGSLRYNGTSVVSTNQNALWVASGTNIALIARGGNPAPGVTGAYFESFNYLSVNDLGQAAFRAFLSDGSYGLWATDLNGTLQLIAHRGDTIEVAPGDFRIIQTTNPAGNPEAEFFHDRRQGSAFNASGHLLYRLRFSDGTGSLMLADVAELPSISITQSAPNVQLMWQTNSVPFQLESSPSLGNTANWQAIPSTPGIVNGSNVVTFTAGPTKQFFRLRLN